MYTRRNFIKAIGATGIALCIPCRGVIQRVIAQPASPLLDPLLIPKYQAPLLIPPAMPKAGRRVRRGGKNVDYYEISVRQFEQQILPAGMPGTMVWGYGALSADRKRGLLLHNAPSLTIEAQWNRPVRVKWVNDLVDESGNYLPHLLPVDPTLHWANPPGGTMERDMRPSFATTPGAYAGPVPMVTHVHGAVGVGDESDGYAEAWYLPAAANIPSGYADRGTWYDFFAAKAAAVTGEAWGPGYSICEYPNHNRASTIWYHDHTLGMTRLNVYAGPAGFYIIRGGPDGDDAVMDTRSGTSAVLPGPAPKENDQFPPNKTYFEIPVAVQDRTFYASGALFYPNTREIFDGITGPFIPDGPFSPIWNPEFFGNCVMVNGNTWPFQVVQRRRYRFRFLNGCQSRFLILDFNRIPGVEVWQIGNEGGFLTAPVNLSAANAKMLPMGLAERADLIVDFTGVPEGNYVLGNVGPDEPFGGGLPGVDFDPADPETTGQIMEFRVVPAVGPDLTTPPQYLKLPPIAPFPAETVTRRLALIEEAAEGADAEGSEVEGPVEALLGVVSGDPNVEPGIWAKQSWMDPVTENPAVGATEVWEIYNTTGDAHPMHIHEVVFAVINRQPIYVDEETQQVLVVPGSVALAPEPWERGFKDTVTAYPEQVTRIRLQFKTAGQFVWHCHIVEHEDNEMMRPYRIGPVQPGQPG